MRSSAITFNSPQQVSLHSLALPTLQFGDVAVVVQYSGINTATERLLWDGALPRLNGGSYPVVPGYESVGRVAKTHSGSVLKEGQLVFIPRADCFEGVNSLYGATASHLVVSERVAMPMTEDIGADGVLMALAATAYHAVSGGGQHAPFTPPDLIIGHNVMGRLLARLTIAAGFNAPTVWETNAALQKGADAYTVIHPSDDDRNDYTAIYDVTGDTGALDDWLQKLHPAGELVLAGIYREPLSFTHGYACAREARIRTTNEWTRADLLAVNQLVSTGQLSLHGLITHVQSARSATDAYQTVFGDVSCLKMVLDWSA